MPRKHLDASPIDLDMYLEHVVHPRSPACGCNMSAPDYMCDVGHALFQVEKRAKTSRMGSGSGARG